jgi:hypothetical protein
MHLAAHWLMVRSELRQHVDGLASEPPETVQLGRRLSAHSGTAPRREVRKPEILAPRRRKPGVDIQPRADSMDAAGSAPFREELMSPSSIQRLAGAEGAVLGDCKFEQEVVEPSMCHSATMNLGCDSPARRPF